MNAAMICFIVCHGGGAAHLAPCAKYLKEQGFSVTCHVEQGVADRFRAYSIEPEVFSLERASEEKLPLSLIEKCKNAAYIITDGGHSLSVTLHQKCIEKLLKIPHDLYIDNPESFVRGGYSQYIAQAINKATGAIFASATLAQGPLFQEEGAEVALPENRCGIGLYPTDIANEMTTLRNKNARVVLKDIFGIEPNVVVLGYLGGNNDYYFEKALPHFLDLLLETENVRVFLQQHPGAKKENKDLHIVTKWQYTNQAHAHKIEISKMQSTDLIGGVDAVVYNQTTLAPQCVFANIPLIWVGPDLIYDVVIRSSAAFSVTNTDTWKTTIATITTLPEGMTGEHEKKLERLRHNLGVTDSPFERFKEYVMMRMGRINSTDE